MLDEETKESINSQVERRVGEEIRKRWAQLLFMGVSGLVAFVGLFIFILNSAVKTEANNYVRQHFEAYDTASKASGLSDRIALLSERNERFLEDQDRRFGAHLATAEASVYQLQRQVEAVDSLVAAAENDLNAEQARATRFAQTLNRFEHLESVRNNLVELETSLDEIEKSREFLTLSYEPALLGTGAIVDNSSCFEAVSFCNTEGFLAVSGACEGARDSSLALVTSGPDVNDFQKWVCRWCSVSDNPSAQSIPPTLTSQAICLSVELSKP